MAPLLLPLFFLLLPVQLLLAVADAVPDSCIKAMCGDQDIHYPFWLSSSIPDCGFQGIGLVCEGNSTLILPYNSHRYKVWSIDYKTHTVMVSDADVAAYAVGCPRLHVNLTIDTTWLQLAPSDSNITFLYNCKKSITLPSAVELSGCLPQQQDGGNRSYALQDGGAEAYEFECEAVVVAPVLDMHKKAVLGGLGGPSPGTGNGSLLYEVLQGGFELNYTHSQQCDRCEGSGGWCGYQPDKASGGRMMLFACFCEGGPTSDRCGDTSPSSALALGSQPKDFDSKEEHSCANEVTVTAN